LKHYQRCITSGLGNRVCLCFLCPNFKKRRHYENWLHIETGGKSAGLPLDVDGRIGASWSKGKFYEDGLLKHVHSLKLGGTYIDVGMNCGNHILVKSLEIMNAFCKLDFGHFLEINDLQM
jgi:hypothetical protein